MALKRVGPEEAKRLVEEEGYVYVDVRSVPEFEAGHPEGAYNVPIAHLGRMGMAPNPDFLRVMEERFGPDAKIVVGCKSGGRSLQAASILLDRGFRSVVDQRAGFDGMPGDPGWRPRGLPVSATAAPDHTWEGLK
ncbi:MAG TPA: rhodanese-like domain-containing protein [Vicinamibacteria bacterium]|nr:rhodanese-like domain-containing protein [Vicinamibacteria bacterium]